MKLHPVFTAGTVASLIAAPSLTPTYANAAENILYFRVTVGAESEPTADTEESDSPETEVAEEQHADEEVPEEIEAPEPADEVETTPDVLEAEVETPEIIEGEPRSEPEVRVQDDAADQATQASTIEPLEIYSAVPTEADPLGTLEASSVDSVVQAAAPRSQAPAADGALPLSPQRTAQSPRPTVQESAAAAILPSVQASVGAGEGTPRIAANEDNRDIPPEPRKIDTIDPTEINEERNSSEPADNETETNEPEEQNIQSAVRPADEPLSQTGASSIVLALGGVLLLATGVVLVSRRRRVSELKTAGRRAKRQ